MERSFTNKKFIESLESFKNILDTHGTVRLSDIRMFNPLVLAYVGDAVFEVFVRTLLVSDGSMQVAKLHKKAIKFVKAKSQAEILESISSILKDEELEIVKRGRNTKTSTIPKNADISDYRYATGLEALIGYLYLIGDIERLTEIFDEIAKTRK